MKKSKKLLALIVPIALFAVVLVFGYDAKSANFKKDNSSAFVDEQEILADKSAYWMLDMSNGPASLATESSWTIDSGGNPLKSYFSFYNQDSFPLKVGGNNIPYSGISIFDTFNQSLTGAIGTADANNLGIGYTNVFALFHNPSIHARSAISITETDGVNILSDYGGISQDEIYHGSPGEKDAGDLNLYLASGGTSFNVEGSTGNITSQGILNIDGDISGGGSMNLDGDINSNGSVNLEGDMIINGSLFSASTEIENIKNIELLVGQDAGSEFRNPGHSSFGNRLINHPDRGYYYSHADKVIDVVEDETEADDWNIDRQKGAAALEFFSVPPAGTTINRQYLGSINIAQADLSNGDMTVDKLEIIGSDTTGKVVIKAGESYPNIQVYGIQAWMRGATDTDNTGKAGTGYGAGFGIEANNTWFSEMGAINSLIRFTEDNGKADNVKHINIPLSMSGESKILQDYKGTLYSINLLDNSSIARNLIFSDINNPYLEPGASIGGNMVGLQIDKLSGASGENLEIALAENGGVYFRSSENNPSMGLNIKSEAENTLNINSNGNIILKADTSIQFLNGKVGIGTDSPNSILSVVSDESSTTTVEFGDIYSGQGKACINMPDSYDGSVASFYIYNGEIIVENKKCIE